MRFLGLAASAAFLITLSAGAGADAAEEAAFLERFEGEFVGEGKVRPERGPGPISVDCTLKGTSEGGTFEMEGECGAFLMSRKIGARITTDGKGYKGQYFGSRSGPSELVGARTDDTLELDLTWPRVVFDDNKAVLTLINDGSGSFVLRVIDSKRGKEFLSTDVTFRRAQ